MTPDAATSRFSEPAHAASVARAHAPSVKERLAWLGLAILTALGLAIFWAFDALPFQDLPAHAGLIALRHRFASSAFEQRFYVLAPHIGPYSVFRFLGEVFHRVVGPVGAVRALASLPMIATPVALLFARRRLFDDRTPTYGYLGILLSFGLMTLLGFASYLLGVAVMLGGLVLWLSLSSDVDLQVTRGRRGPLALPATWRGEALLALYTPLVFVAHGHAFLLFLLLAVTSSFVGERPLARLLRLRAVLPALGLAAYVAWIERASTSPPGSARLTGRALEPHFQEAADKLSLLATPTLMTRTGLDLLVGTGVWIFAIAGAILTIRDLPRLKAPTPEDRTRKALLLCAVVVAVMFLALPHAVGWFGFVDGRLVPIVLVLLLLGVDRTSLSAFWKKVLDRGAPGGAAVVVVVSLVASQRFQTEAAGYREVLRRVPEHASLLNLPLDPNSDVFTGHPFIHYDKLVLAEKDVVVSDIWFHQGSALYPTEKNPSLRLPSTYSESNLLFIDWPAYDLSEWNWVLIRTRPGAPPPSVPAALALDEHQGGWWLYRTR